MVHEELISAVSQQLESPDTPFVKKAHQRLTNEEKIEHDEALEMIAHCLADELDTMTTESRDFDLKRYELLLTLLPSLPEA